jgi:short-subunit dehydrogenase involved in D-alanine esterification of teichoic acids
MKSIPNRKLLNLIADIQTFGLGFILDRLVNIYRTDKAGSHSYSPHYQLHLKKFKLKEFLCLK